VRTVKDMDGLEMARHHLDSVIDVFQGAGTGGEGSNSTNATDTDDDDVDIAMTGGEGGNSSLTKELETQKAHMEALKKDHALKEQEWTTAHEVMKKKLEESEKALEIANQKQSVPSVGNGTHDVTDEEVEEAIEGTSVLLHHPLLTVSTDASQMGSNGSKSNTTCEPLLPADSTKPDGDCKMFSAHGERCEKDLSFAAAGKFCESKGAHICSHKELVDAFKAGYSTTVCGWTTTVLSGEGRLVENILQADGPAGKKGFNVCEIEKNDGALNGVHCCGTSL